MLGVFRYASISEDCLLAVSMSHFDSNGVLQERRFYWRVPKSLPLMGDELEEAWNRLCYGLGIKADDIEGYSLTPVPLELPTGKQEVTLGL